MNRVRFGGLAALALTLAACGGGSEDAAAPAGGEDTAIPQTPELASSEPAAAPTTAPGQAPVAFAQCKACHSVEPGKQGIGPSLAGIYGTKAAEVEGFTFSPAMVASGLTWDDATLDAYLESPQKTVPGTKMSFFGLKDAAKRKDVIEYIKTLK